MDSTSISPLRRLRLPNQEAAWQRFVDLYAPLIFFWGGRHGLDATDTADLVQDVMAILVIKLPGFEYDPQQRFRGWLRTVTLNTARNLQRRDSAKPATGHDDTLDRISVADQMEKEIDAWQEKRNQEKSEPAGASAPKTPESNSKPSTQHMTNNDGRTTTSTSLHDCIGSPLVIRSTQPTITFEWVIKVP